MDNHLGSAGMELDEVGAVISYEEYHPYGSTAFHAMRGTVEVSAKRYRYTGKEKDEETGLYYHGARYYAAWLGRWTSADPLGVTQPGRADLDLFAYVRGRPLSNVDRTGLDDDVPTPKKTRENGRASREHDKIPTVILTGSQTGTPMGREAGMAAGRAANAAAHRVSQMMRYLSWEGDFLKLRIPGADVQYARAEQLERAAIKTQEEERDEGRQFQPQSVVLHFTGDLQTQGTLRSWQTSATKGAHFLVSPEGVVYQTASLNRTVQHVRSYTWQGQRRARCATEGSCTGGTPQLRLGDQAEIDKPFPERYPFNWEAIGIELVHGPVRGKYPPITKVQFEATKALVRALQDAFGIDAAQILAHVDMDRKMPGEGIIPELTAGHRRPAALGKPVGVQP